MFLYVCIYIYIYIYISQQSNNSAATLGEGIGRLRDDVHIELVALPNCKLHIKQYIYTHTSLYTSIRVWSNTCSFQTNAIYVCIYIYMLYIYIYKTYIYIYKGIYIHMSAARFVFVYSDSFLYIEMYFCVYMRIIAPKFICKIWKNIHNWTNLYLYTYIYIHLYLHRNISVYIYTQISIYIYI